MVPPADAVTLQPPPLPRRVESRDREGRAIQLAVREIESRRRWRTSVIWGLSLSICAGFGWLTVLTLIIGSDAGVARIRTDALVACLASAAWLAYQARRHFGPPATWRPAVLGGIFYLTALGGLAWLGVWLTVLALTIQIGSRWSGSPSESVVGAAWAWLVSGLLTMGLWSAVVAILLRLPVPAPGTIGGVFNRDRGGRETT